MDLAKEAASQQGKEEAALVAQAQQSEQRAAANAASANAEAEAGKAELQQVNQPILLRSSVSNGAYRCLEIARHR